VELMKQSLYDMFEDEHGNIDCRRMTGVSKPKQMKLFVAELNKICDAQYNNNFTKQQLQEVAKKMGLVVDGPFDDFVERLNHAGYLLKAAGQAYKLATTGY